MTIILVVMSVTWFFLMPFCGGLMFLYGGLNYLVNFNPDYDDPKKKWRAALDIVLGAFLLFFFHAVFWLIVYPNIVAYYGLNLPTF